MERLVLGSFSNSLGRVPIAARGETGQTIRQHQVAVRGRYQQRSQHEAADPQEEEENKETASTTECESMGQKIISCVGYSYWIKVVVWYIITKNNKTKS